MSAGKDEITEQQWRERLTPEQFAVARKGGTERAFSGAYWDCHDEGTYRCVCCAAPVFLSRTKFDSGTGWPSFSAPASEESVTTRTDRKLFLRRTEVMCARCHAHLGHVFPDGPEPTRLRFCINSTALSFEKHADDG